MAALILIVLLLPCISFGKNLGSSEIRVLGFLVDADARPDIGGFQNSMTAVKNFPASVDTFVGFPGEDGQSVSAVLPAGFLVRAELSGPAFSDGAETLSAVPNQPMELPGMGVPGDYTLSDIRLEDGEGKRILERDPTLPPVTITVIDKLLVTQVTSRPLTLSEIEEKGIVIDEDNFTAMNFSVGMTLGSEQVVIDLPVMIPNSSQGIARIPEASATFNFEPARAFDNISIPNLSLVGFSLRVPEEEEDKELNLPPISGVIVIPGNIAFLNQFFSVILQATNVAPEGSGLNLEDAAATIVLPPGGDDTLGTGDDPLRVAETRTGGVLTSLKLLNDEGTDVVVPGGTNKAEFLVEGIREGTHTVTFDITGNLYIPSLGKAVEMTGRAAGTVQVRNPSFSVTLAHPDVVRAGEAYSVFATVTNTSSVPANLFQLKLNTRSLSGARLADSENGMKTLDTLMPGQAETFEYHLVARTTGKVTGTVFLADPGINGSFVLNTGVGDTGIPLSPDTLVLPQTVDYLPDNPDLVFAAVRLLGQAYSIATAPGGSLPDNISRMSKTHVFDRAVKLAQAGLHVRFGENRIAAAEDILMDYFGNDLERLETLVPGRERNVTEKDMRAFDLLRRTSDAGKNLSDVLGKLLGDGISGSSPADMQKEWAERFASRSPHISFAVGSPDSPVCLRLTDGADSGLGRLNSSEEMARDIPFADRLDLLPAGPGHAELLFVAAPESETYTAEFVFPDGASEAEISLILPDGEEMKQVIYPPCTLPAGSHGKMVYSGEQDSFEFAIDTDGDGSADQTLTPTAATAVTDSPPVLTGVLQWAKGDRPMTTFDFATGDPLGRMVGVLFSEEVTQASATNANHYSMPDHRTEQISFQPDRRMVFLMMNEPAGAFVSRDLSVSKIEDMKGHILEEGILKLGGDPERGEAGVVSGIVQGPDGRPVPFAEVKYIQPVHYEGELEAWTRDFVVSTVFADADGRYQIDFVLKNNLRAENSDIWLNKMHAGGTDHFKLEAADPVSGNTGRASARILYDGQRMTLNVIIRGYGNIEGTLYDEDGNLVTGGTSDELAVYARNISTGESYAAEADETGRYALSQVAVGNVVLQVVRSDGYTGVVTANLPASDMTVSQDIFLISPNRYGTVAGRVLENNGSGAANVMVQIAGRVLTGISLYEREYKNGVVGSVHTDENGFFEFDHVPAGDIEVRAFRQETYEQAGVRSVLGEREDKTLTIVLPGSGGTVRGHVTDAFGNTVGGATVVAGPHQTETGENGFFEISDLPLGRFTVYAQAPDTGAVGKIKVDLLSSDDIQEVIISLEPVGTVRGTVYEADYTDEAEKKPVPFQKVQLWAGDKGVMAETYTDKDGKYQFKNCPVRRYSVRAVQADYGDGGMVPTDIRYAGDVRDADITFRGLGEIWGRVIHNGTPVISDVIITRKVWRIIPEKSGVTDNYYLDYIRALQEQTDSETVSDIQDTLDETGATAPPAEFFMLTEEPVLISSDILNADGTVSGRFRFTGPVTGGPFRVAAFGPFLTPAEVSGEIPKTGDPAQRIVDVDDIVLASATGRVTGTVYMPDGQTPVGEGVKVTVRSLDSSGSVRLPGNYGGSVSQPVLPVTDVTTGPDGTFEFPLVLRGRFILTADTGVPASPPDGPGTADSAANMETERFYDRMCAPDDTGCLSERRRALNVRLYGQANGVVSSDGEVAVSVRLNDMAGIRVKVVQNDGVTGADQAVVTVKTASTLDENEEALFRQQVADEDGTITFFPVIEGKFSVSARAPESPVSGQASGEIPVNPANGHVTDITVTLGAVTDASGNVSDAPFFGTVTGTVFRADGTPLKNPAQVTVTSAGVSILTTSGEDGTYRAESVPGGTFTVDAFEPFTARRGIAYGRIGTDGQETDVPVTLVGLGTVTGQVFRADGSETISGADVVLNPPGTFTDPLISRTDTQGQYVLPGVPVGQYTVTATDYNSNLTGTAEGEMLHDGDTGTTDIYLAASGSVAGTVYAAGVFLSEQGEPADENGVPVTGAPVAANVEVTISGNGYRRTDVTRADGGFGPFENLPAGTYTLRAATDNDGTSANVTLTYDGQTEAVNMALAGTGTVRGFVFDSGCESPVNVASVTLHSRSSYSTGSVRRITGEDGVFEFRDVPVGDFSVSVETTDGGITLGGAASGRLDRHGQIVIFADGDDDPEHNAICLQPSGKITGTVFLADGTTPAAGAVAEVVSGSIRAARLADDAGFFSFEGLPLGTYGLSVREPITNGVAGRTAELDDNGETADLGTIVLDSRSPFVVSVSPGAGASDVDPDASVVITFSEKIDPSSVTSETFQVAAGGSAVTGVFQVSDTAPTVTFVPSGGLPDLKQASVLIRGDKTGFEGEVIESGIRDLAGLGMTSDFSFSFSTADATPPEISSVSPAGGASGVATDSVIRIEFSEPVVHSSVVSFTLKTDGTPVAGSMNETPLFGGRVFVFTPAGNLLPNRTYTVSVAGPVTDPAGNAMAENPIVRTFSTVDTLPPAIQSFGYPDGTRLIRGETVELTAVPDADAVSVEFYLENRLAASVAEPPYVYVLRLAPELGAAAEVKAVAIDAAGNRSGASLLSLAITENQPPDIAITSPGNISVSQGLAVEVGLDAADDTGLKTVAFTANDGDIFSWQKTLSGETAHQAGFSFTVPHDFPAGETLVLRASATDSSDQVSVSGEVRLTVTDQTGPHVVIGTPANNAVFDPGYQVPVFIRADDPSGIREFRLIPGGDFGAEDFAADELAPRVVDPAASPASATFVLTIPSDVPSAGTLTVRAEAEDSTGNTGTSAVVRLNISDKAPPKVISTVPADGAGNVSAVSAVTVEFDEAVDPATVTTETFRVFSAQGDEVPGAVIVTDGNRKAVWLPRPGFGFGGTYRVSLTDGITDAAGNPAEPYESGTGFTVTDFAITLPSAGDRAVEGQEITLRADGNNTDGIRAVGYYLAGDPVTPLGTGEAPAPFEAAGQIPVYGEETTVSIRAEAVSGGNNIVLSPSVSGSDGSYEYAFLPERAADGNTDGRFSGGSVAAVMGTPRGWWEADLGSIALVDKVVIHLNTECCHDTNRFAVLIAGEPFADEDFAGELLPEAYGNGAAEIYRTGDDPDTGSVTVTGLFMGRYIRIVHLGEDFLGLAEVGIFEREALIPVPEEVQVPVFEAGGDEDGDGTTNGDEIAAGTDPFQP